MSKFAFGAVLILCASALCAFDSDFWSDIRKFPVPEYRWGERESGKKARQIFYAGENYKGEPTEVFAYYCTPGILKGDPSLDKNLPAVVCLHGGGGRAYPEWVELWASRGYAAIAMDWSGNGPEPFYKNPTPQMRKKYGNYHLEKRVHLKNGGPDKIPSTVSLADGKPERDAWAYQAVGAIVRAHSLLRSFKEIDADRTALTGISWGGYLTCLVSGIDGRFKAAVPVYGCGFIYEYGRWGSNVGKGDKSEARWIELFDPSKSLEVTKVPMFFVNAPVDPWYPLSIWTKSARLARATTLLDSEMKHGHSAGWTPPEIEAFISSKLNATPPLPELGDVVLKGSHASCALSSKTKIKSARLYYTLGSEGGNWEKFKWESVPAEISGDALSAKLPDGALAAYFGVVDERGLRSSSNAAIFSSDKK